MPLKSEYIGHVESTLNGLRIRLANPDDFTTKIQTYRANSAQLEPDLGCSECIWHGHKYSWSKNQVISPKLAGRQFSGVIEVECPAASTRFGQNVPVESSYTIRPCMWKPDTNGGPTFSFA